MSNDKRLSKSQLSKLGFIETSPGIWGKADIRNDNPKPPAPELEQRARRGPAKKARNQGQRKAEIPRGLRYRLVIHSFRVALIDPSNPYLKVIEDCLTTHGIIPDDGPQFCDQPIFLQTRVMPGDERTKIEVLAYRVGEEESQ